MDRGIRTFGGSSSGSSSQGDSPQGGPSSSWAGQKWEYKTILRTRGWREKAGNVPWHNHGAWDVYIETKLSELGEAGWELVAISPRSGILGGVYNLTTSHDYAGYTDEELWVFKRPKP